MVFTHLFVSAITVSMVLSRVANTVPADLTFTHESIDSGSKNSSFTIPLADNPLDDNDRDSNLKYVLAIKNSTMWTEIKRRSLMISSEPDSKSLFDKPTKNLSDQELSQLKQVCQDGLKCVAVDQLMVLRQAKQTDGGKTVVRKAINKITKVLTDYTNEYHEEKYQYEAVTDADDTDKMHDSVMTIMEDNRELCQIDPYTYTSNSTSLNLTTSSSVNISSAESSNKSSESSSNNTSDGSSNGNSNIDSDRNSNKSFDISSNQSSDSSSKQSSDSSSNNTSDGSSNGISNIDSDRNSNKSSDSSSKQSSDSSSNQSSDSSLTGNSDSSDKKNSALITIVNKGSVNFGTVNQYSVNEGTTNTAIVNLKPSNSTPSDDPSKSSEEPNSPPTIRNESPTIIKNESPAINGSPPSIIDPPPTIIKNESPAINGSPPSIINPPPTIRSDTERLGEDRRANTQYLKQTYYGQKQNVSNNKIPESDSLPVKTVSSDQTAASTDTGSCTCCTSANPNTSTSTDNSTSDAGAPAETDGSSSGTVHNFIKMDNGEDSAFGKNESRVDMASTGSNNNETVNKGYVEDGNLNNGLMKIYNINTGTINKGVITNSGAEGGIINVGTVNNGQTDYSQFNSSTNKGKESLVNNYDVQIFASAIEKIYSDIYDRLSRQ